MNENHQYSILVVDDEPRICETMTMLLSGSGYEVATAIHGLDALNKLRDAIPNVIISDLNMPLMSGIEFLSVLRRRFRAIPVIAMSGAYPSEDQFAREVMADAYYCKGCCHPQDLLSKVSRLIHTRG
jgi:CheY-like chemotaxis protein